MTRPAPTGPPCDNRTCFFPAWVGGEDSSTASKRQAMNHRTLQSNPPHSAPATAAQHNKKYPPPPSLRLMSLPDGGGDGRVRRFREGVLREVHRRQRALRPSGLSHEPGRLGGECTAAAITLTESFSVCFSWGVSPLRTARVSRALFFSIFSHATCGRV